MPQDIRLLSVIYTANINSQFDIFLILFMINTFLMGNSNLPCSYMTEDENNSGLGNWGSIPIGLVNGDFQL